MRTDILLNTLKVLLAASVIAMTAGLASCSKSSPVSDDDTALFSATLPDADETQSEVSDASESQPMSLLSPHSDKRRVDDFGRHCMRNMLHLTADQRQQIITFHHQHEVCFRAILDSLRSSERAILAVYKPQYQAIKDNLANGVIDTATARQQFHDLRAQVRTELVNNPVRAWARTEFASCRQEFIENVRSILTVEQLRIFNAWVAAHHR